MASVNIPFNLDSHQNAQKARYTNTQVISNFYAYQDPHSGVMPETQISASNEEQDLCFKKTLLIVIIALSSITLIKSCAINCFNLSKNIALHFQLKNHKKNLMQSKARIKDKIKANNSYRGMKKIIREEIKALDANEILIRFES
jgi:hypothetical protein